MNNEETIKMRGEVADKSKAGDKRDRNFPSKKDNMKE